MNDKFFMGISAGNVFYVLGICDLFSIVLFKKVVLIICDYWVFEIWLV